MGLSIVGSIVVVVGLVQPPSGWSFLGTVIQVQLPAGLESGIHRDTFKVVPRWNPEDVAELLEGYDAEWQAARPSFEAMDSLQVTVDRQATDHAPGDSAAPGLEDRQVIDSTSTPPIPPRPPTRTAPAPRDWTAISDVLKVSIPEASRPAFERLFFALEEHGNVNVLHFGDSQIEADRISGVLRHAWQQRWGGYGPGLQPAVPLVQSFALRQSHSDGWSRHTRYGRRDTTDMDERYGLLACYAAFPDSTDLPACLTVGPEVRNHSNFGRWDGIRIWHDSVTVDCPISLDGMPADTLRAGTPAAVLDIPLVGDSTLPNTGLEARICFNELPPRLFAIEPMGRGVQWHGVPMRGSSGTLFRKLDRPLFRQQLSLLDPELIILQYGGNTVPYCRDKAAADRYGSWFASQIRLFQLLLPESAILVIGPSDMSEKKGVDWSTFPRLVDVRDAVARAASEEGVAFWDLLDVMGGVGSMPAWVQSTPPLAGPDHVHFTPLGARKVGTLLDRSLLASYGEWKMNWTPAPPATLDRKGAVSVAPPHAPAAQLALPDGD